MRIDLHVCLYPRWASLSCGRHGSTPMPACRPHFHVAAHGTVERSDDSSRLDHAAIADGMPVETGKRGPACSRHLVRLFQTD